MLIDGTLPGEEFLDRQSVPRAGLFKRKQAAAHRDDNLRLAANDPALGPRRRQIRDRQWSAIGTDHVFYPRGVGLVYRHIHIQKLSARFFNKAVQFICLYAGHTRARQILTAKQVGAALDLLIEPRRGARYSPKNRKRRLA